jgi:hypothetical protein
MEAVKIRLLFIDDNRSAIMVNISVVIALINDDGVVAIPMITVADDVTVAVSVTISVTLTNRYAHRADTNSYLFSNSRHCAANSSYGGDHYGILDHCVLLSLLNSGKAMPRRSDRSGSPAQANGRCIGSLPRDEDSRKPAVDPKRHISILNADRAEICKVPAYSMAT